MKITLLFAVVVAVTCISDYCKISTEADKCALCTSNYFIKDNICNLVSTKVENCYFYFDDATKCVFCANNYNLKDNKCEKPKAEIKNCVSYVSDHCISCSNGTVPNKDYTDCVEDENWKKICSVSLFSALYGSSNVCLQCLTEKQIFNVENGTCVEDSKLENCQIKNKDVCIVCNDKTEITKDGKCVAFPEESSFPGWIIAALVILALAGIAAAVYFFVLKKKKTELEEEIM